MYGFFDIFEVISGQMHDLMVVFKQPLVYTGISVETGSGHPDQPGHILPGSSRSDPL